MRFDVIDAVDMYVFELRFRRSANGRTVLIGIGSRFEVRESMDLLSMPEALYGNFGLYNAGNNLNAWGA